MERLLHAEKSNISLRKAAELTQNMYQITYILPDSKNIKARLLKMNDANPKLGSNPQSVLNHL